MKFRIALLICLSAALTGMATAAHARARTLSALPLVQQETDDAVKVDIYKKFTENRVSRPEVAYDAAREYLRRYKKDNDQYTNYMSKWVAAYERDERERKLLLLVYHDKNFAEAYALARQVLADNPENVGALMALGYGGYMATTAAKNETFNADAILYARKAIKLIEAGKAPETWEPFKNRDDALASLNYAIGFMELKGRPEEAISRFIKAVQYASDLKSTPSTYYYLAFAYQNGPYRKLSADYSARFADKPETAESKAALAALNKVIDRMIDAYARAVALAGNDPRHQAAKAEWTKSLTEFYKFRHDNSDAGLKELIAGISSELGLPRAPGQVASINETVTNSPPSSVEAMLDKTLKGVLEIETDSGAGSGFFATPGCLAVTNAHVVVKARTIFLKTASSPTQSFTAQLVAKDEGRDLALLRTNAPFCTALPLEDSNRAIVGQEVYAIGSPAGLSGTVTRSIISALRKMDGTEYIQLDASVNPGNSGGPLITKSGKVVGVNTFKVRGSQGLNFAVASNEIRKAFGQLLQ